MLKRISAFVGSLIRGESAPPREPFGVVEHDASRLRLTRTLDDGSEHVSEAEWGEVTRVIAYKRDLVTRDLISLGVFLEGRPGIDVNEEMEGWEGLLKKLPEYLPGCRPPEQWFGAVASPAFAMNPTQIFRREGAAPERTGTQTEARSEAPGEGRRPS